MFFVNHLASLLYFLLSIWYAIRYWVLSFVETPRVKDLEKERDQLLDENKSLFESLQLADETTELLDRTVSSNTMTMGLVHRHYTEALNSAGNTIGAIISSQGGQVVVPLSVMEAMTGVAFKIKEDVSDSFLTLTIEEVEQNKSLPEPVFEDDISDAGTPTE